MPSLEGPLPLLVQVTAEDVRLVLEPLSVLQPGHDLPLRALPAARLLLPLALAAFRLLLFGGAVGAQAVGVDAGVGIAGVDAGAVAHLQLDLAQLRALLRGLRRGHLGGGRRTVTRRGEITGANEKIVTISYAGQSNRLL